MPRVVIRGMLLTWLVVLQSACSTEPAKVEQASESPDLTVFVRPTDQPLVAESLARIGDPRLHLQIAADPLAAAQAHGNAAIALTARTDCQQCYGIQHEKQHVQAHGGLPLGLQYGLAQALEAFGYRFPHPRHAKIPAHLRIDAPPGLDGEHAPEVVTRRGLHLHTLHPIEGLFDFWVPSPAHLQGALATLDFLVANRGNYLQWAALDDIDVEKAKLAPWQAHTRAITAAAHLRGVKIGIAIQLFGMSNLQNAFDLIDSDAPAAGEMARRLHVLLDGNGFDTVNLSFGEFIGADPATFVQEVDHAYQVLQEVQPGAEMTATIHVGNYPKLEVTYQGKKQLYYFLVQYANPAIVPWVHSVMYFDLFEDAGGAYLHDNFDAHKDFITGRLQAGKPVGYFPESAYWVAFDNCVPVMLPLYIRSRRVDLDGFAAHGQLQDHVLFSSGWEWGYWLTDLATLRMNFARPKTWDGDVAETLRAWGQPGVQMADLLRELAEVQHAALIGQRLAAYLGGRDILIDLGETAGIVSQPTRVKFDAILAMTAEARGQFETKVLVPLGQFAVKVSELSAKVQKLEMADDPWLVELADGFAVTAARARFVHLANALVVATAAGQPTEPLWQQLDAALADGQAVVTRRHGKLWYPEPANLTQDVVNPTLYQYGYLRDADDLCFWRRERAQVRNLLLHTTDAVPPCVM